MRQLGSIVAILASLALLVGCVAAAYFGIAFVVNRFAGLDPTIATIGIAAMITLLVAARIVSGGPRAAKREEVEGRLRLQKAETYLHLIDAWTGLLDAATATEPKLRQRLDADLMRIERQLLVQASVDVIKRYTVFRSHCASRSEEIPALLDRLLLEIRKDLGRGNVALPEGILLELLRLGRPEEA